MQITGIELFHYPCTRSARVKWLLHELVGDAFTVTRVDLYGAEQYHPDYLEMNPNHNVPMVHITTAKDGIIRMLESGAIVQWFADAFPDKRLAPEPSLSPQRADYLQMLYFGASWMDMMLWQIRIHEHILAGPDKDERTIARYRKKFTTEVEPQLAARFGKTSFICGDTFSAADCVIGLAVMWAKAYGLCADQVFDAYIERLKQRPAFAKAFADQHEFVLAAPQDSPLVAVFTG